MARFAALDIAAFWNPNVNVWQLPTAEFGGSIFGTNVLQHQRDDSQFERS